MKICVLHLGQGPEVLQIVSDTEEIVMVQVRFEQPICLTGIKVGAAPGTGPGAAVTPHIHLFAYDLSTLGAARFAVLTEDCTLPTSGTKAVRIEVRSAHSPIYLQKELPHMHLVEGN